MNNPSLKKAAVLGCAALAAVFLVYSALWLVISGRIKEAAEDFRVSLMESGYEVTGAPVTVKGFPGAHKARFSGEIRGYGVAFDIPSLDIKGVFLPGREITISMPEGFEVSGPAAAHGLTSADRAALSFVIPDEIPDEFTRADMRRWQEHNNSLRITGFSAEQQVSSIRGSGIISLDPALQLYIRAQINLTGHEDMIRKMVDAGVIKENKGSLIAALMTVAGKINAETGRSELELPVSVRNRSLYIGPLKAASLPAIEWPLPRQDTHTPPDQLR